MTYDPYRNELPNDPYREYRDPNGTSAGAGLLLGALLLAALGGFIYFFSTGDQNVATNEMRPPITQPSTTGSGPAPETTGSSTSMTPAPSMTPTPAEPKAKPAE
jgi:hypothetical protein